MQWPPQSFLQTIVLCKCQKPVAAVHNIRQHDQATERNPGIESIGRDSMLLASIGTDKQFHTSANEFGITRVAKILHSLIEEIEIEIHTFSQGLRREVCHRLDTGV